MSTNYSRQTNRPSRRQAQGQARSTRRRQGLREDGGQRRRAGAPRARSSRQRTAGSQAVAVLGAIARGIGMFVLACAEALGALFRFVRDAISGRRGGSLYRRPQTLELRHVLTLVVLAVVVAIPVGTVNSCNARQAAEARAVAAGEQGKKDAVTLALDIPAAAKRVAKTYVTPTSTPQDEWAKGQMPYLYQIDDAYKNERYSNGSMRLQGCGPFALTMVYIDLTGDTSMGPVEMAAYATKSGYSTNQNGSAWALIGDGAAGLGLKSETLPASADSIKTALEAGKDVICIMGPGTFTRVGHFIAIDGLDADGRAIVHDSNSYIRSHQTWDLSLIVSEANNIWALSA